MRCIFPIFLALAACVPQSPTMTIALEGADVVVSVQPDATAPATMARLTPEDVLTCSRLGADGNAQSRTYAVPGLHLRVTAVVGPDGPSSSAQNANSQVGQTRAFPYRTPPAELIAVLNDAVVPDTCLDTIP